MTIENISSSEAINQAELGLPFKEEAQQRLFNGHYVSQMEGRPVD